MTTEWRALVNAAMLGTGRQGAPMVPADGICTMPDDASAEVQMLHRISILSVYERAGRVPEQTDTDGPAPGSTTERQCSTTSASHLADILYGDHSDLLAEWCRAAESAGRCAPPELLPALLDRMVGSNADEQMAVSPVLGSRGRWLAALNPDWSVGTTALADNPVQAWAVCTFSERRALLQSLRDTDPELARTLFQSTVTEETADHRAKLLAAFAAGLGSDDEPLLERMLDDRSKQVRTVAVDLLARLPGSALVRRMADRLAGYIAIEPARTGLLRRKPRLELNLPEAVDKAMARDGLAMRKQDKMGVKGAILYQIVGATPLQFWTGLVGDCDEIITAALESDWARPLVTGWIDAAERQNDARWAERLVTRIFFASDAKAQSLRSDLPAHSLDALMQPLSPEQSEQLAKQVLDSTRRSFEDSPLAGLLCGCPFTWSPDLSRRILEALHRDAANPSSKHYVGLWSLPTNTWARHLSPNLADDFASGWPRDAAHWSAGMDKAVDTITTTLSFRRDMLAALLTEGDIP